MNDTLRTRLAELQREYDTGETRLRTLLQQEATLRETLLRISGAIQVLKELLAEEQAGEPERSEDVPADRQPSPEERSGRVDGEPVTMTVP